MLPTCKAATQRDLIYLSPEAAALLRSVEVRDVFMEHALLQVAIAVPQRTLQYPSWPLPSEIPWTEVDFDSWHPAFCNPFEAGSSSTAWLQHFSRSYESSLDSHVKRTPNGKLPQACRGRAQRLAPLQRTAQAVTVKASRPGEEALCCDFLGSEVTKWFKQLRRLQSLRQALDANKQTAAAQDYRLALWQSIKRATGFAAGFASWWPTRPVRLQGSPVLFPVHLPCAVTVRALFYDFRDNFRRLESWHARRRSEILTDRLANSRSALFKAVGRTAPEQVDTLIVRKSYAILATDPATDQVMLDADPDLRGVSSWSVDDVPVCVQQVEGPTCQVTGEASFVEGAQLEQVQLLSSASDLHLEFSQFWRPRWQKHSGLSLSDWSRVLGFASAFLPTLSFALHDISPAEWHNAVRRFKPRAARGPDGYAKADLVNVPNVFTRELLSLLHSVEKGETPWPQQWLEGHVLSLAKGNGKTDVNAYRPIVLFSMVVRTWSGIRARQVLAQLSSQLTCETFGFLPGREALEFWLGLQGEIEVSCVTNSPLGGVSTDLVKAFNALPRLPLFCAAQVLGIPSRLLQPWSQFLNGVRRRFSVRGTVGEAILSDVGFPEGDPLSTVGMVIADVLFHTYLRFFEPRVRSHSFVDNLAVTSAESGALVKSYHLVECFSELLDLQLDPEKTYAWALTPDMRKCLKSLRIPILRHARDLGA